MQEFTNGISYNQLINFKAIIETGNISKAAKTLKVSPASVSQSLKSLENQLGQPLFSRNTRSVIPNETAKRLYEHIRNSMNDLSGAVAQACEIGDSPNGVLSLNMPLVLYRVLLKETITAFRRAYPNIQLNITLSDSLDSRVAKQIDIGFRYGDAVKDDVIARPINHLMSKEKSNLKRALFVSAEYAEKNGIPQSIEALAHHPIVKFKMPTSQTIIPLQLHKTADDPTSEVVIVNTPTAMEVNNADVLVDMVSQGFCMGVMLDKMLEDKFQSGELIPVLKAHWCDMPMVYMYYSKENRATPQVRAFVNFINNLT